MSPLGRSIKMPSGMNLLIEYQQFHLCIFEVALQFGLFLAMCAQHDISRKLGPGGSRRGSLVQELALRHSGGKVLESCLIIWVHSWSLTAPICQQQGLYICTYIMCVWILCPSYSSRKLLVLQFYRSHQQGRPETSLGLPSEYPLHHSRTKQPRDTHTQPHRNPAPSFFHRICEDFEDALIA